MYVKLIFGILFVVYIHTKGRNLLLFVSYFGEKRMQLYDFLIEILVPNLQKLTAKCLPPPPLTAKIR